MPNTASLIKRSIPKQSLPLASFELSKPSNETVGQSKHFDDQELQQWMIKCQKNADKIMKKEEISPFVLSETEEERILNEKLKLLSNRQKQEIANTSLTAIYHT